MIESTRLRFVAASSPDELVAFVDALSFKVEIKGGPIRDKSGWVIFFVIPDNVQEWESVDLR